ncbi:hypothetical protein SAMN04487939_103251 [Lysobacter sp. yr284]|uniref:hypothetical protein n=1 Tax=Lysobacter sp. yr284 TaxID=1761791 RepID=UPI00089991D2|nr:hypothetical protein [Lysobacter sp. yr284]SDY57189.1 hypothetical protein SAMN04487939_103251 [Lysobacter sp. yr284]
MRHNEPGNDGTKIAPTTKERTTPARTKQPDRKAGLTSAGPQIHPEASQWNKHTPDKPVPPDPADQNRAEPKSTAGEAARDPRPAATQITARNNTSSPHRAQARHSDNNQRDANTTDQAETRPPATPRTTPGSGAAIPQASPRNAPRLSPAKKKTKGNTN